MGLSPAARNLPVRTSSWAATSWRLGWLGELLSVVVMGTDLSSWDACTTRCRETDPTLPEFDGAIQHPQAEPSSPAKCAPKQGGALRSGDGAKCASQVDRGGGGRGPRDRI
ncbi:hypothetical protein GCM10028820_13680 [Tessaracoccus terricola]